MIKGKIKTLRFQLNFEITFKSIKSIAFLNIIMVGLFQTVGPINAKEFLKHSNLA